MKNGTLWRKAVTGLIVILTVGICLGLTAGGVILYLRGTAAVAAGTADAVFTLDRAAGFLRLFIIPVLLLAALLIIAALPGMGTARTAAPSVPVRAASSVGAYRRIGTARILVILAAAAVLITLGILNGGLRDVLFKAVSICTECIGLG